LWPGVDVHERERDAGRPEGLLREVQHDDRVLAAAEQQRRPLELRRDLAHHVDALGLEHVELGQPSTPWSCGPPGHEAPLDEHGQQLLDRLVQRLLLRGERASAGGRRLVRRVDAVSP
jgi:hypothetical protein